MKRSAYLLAGIVIISAANGCKTRNEQQTTSQETREGATGGGEQERNAYITTMEGKIAALEQELANIRTRSERVEENLRGEYNQQITAVDDQIRQLRGRLQELKTANESLWQSRRSAVDQSLNDLENSVRRMRERFNIPTTPEGGSGTGAGTGGGTGAGNGGGTGGGQKKP